MKTKKMHQTTLLVVAVIITTSLLAGCSSSKSAGGDSKKGTTLRYSFPENQTLKYKTGADIKQELDIFGQEMIIDIGQYIGYSTTLNAKSKDQNQIHVYIDSMDLSISSPQGDINPDMTSVNGKGFDMTLSSLGAGLDVSEAELIQYEATPGVKRNVAITFKFLFPRLPEKSLKIGDTWSMTDTIAEKYENEEVTMIIEGEYVFSGFETINGFECARISSIISGSRFGKANQQGVDMESDGTMTGSGTYFFAFKDGFLVKDVSSISVDGTLDISAPQEGSFPMTFVIENVTELIK